VLDREGSIKTSRREHCYVIMSSGVPKLNSSGTAVEKLARELGETQKSAIDFGGQLSSKTNSVTVQSPSCSNCGNEFLNLVQESWRCGVCGSFGSLTSDRLHVMSGS